MEPLLAFTSHIAGKNAQVRLFSDRLEWSRKGWMGTGAKAGLAVMTMGTSYLATGVRAKQDGQMIPIRSISHVSRKNSMMQDEVTVSTSGGDVVMRVSRREANQLIDELNALIMGSHASQQQSVAAPPPPAPVQQVPRQPVLPSGMTWEEYYASPEYAAWYRENYPDA